MIPRVGKQVAGLSRARPGIECSGAPGFRCAQARLSATPGNHGRGVSRLSSQAAVEYRLGERGLDARYGIAAVGEAALAAGRHDDGGPR